MSVFNFTQSTLMILKGVLNMWGVLRPYRRRTVEMIGRSLSLPRWKAWVIFCFGLRSFVRHINSYIQLTNLNVKEICNLASQVRLEGESFLRTTIALDRPVLIVTMHMGDFQLGFLKLVEACSPLERQLSVFKMSAADAKEGVLLAAFKNFGAYPQILRANDEGGRRAFLALRAGHVVAMTIDLEVSVKTRSIVRLFGHPCHMQNGPATIALINRSLILPVINSPTIDSVIIGISALVGEAATHIAKSIVEASIHSNKPIVVAWMLPESAVAEPFKILRENQIPVFPSIGAACQALLALTPQLNEGNN